MTVSRWTPDRDADLCRLWRGGLTAERIARKLGIGITRNMVIGRLHRLKMLGIDRAEPERRPVRPPPPPLRDPSCQWPFGDPREADFRFCGADALPDRPYCGEHMARAYTRVAEDAEGVTGE